MDRSAGVYLVCTDDAIDSGANRGLDLTSEAITTGVRCREGGQVE
jgi:hypothetical protein